MIQQGFKDFFSWVKLILLFGHHAILGSPFQVAGERAAFLSFCQVFFLKMQVHDLYRGIYTAIRFIFIASWFLK